MQIPTSSYCDPATAVILICPELPGGTIQVKNIARTLEASMILPLPDGTLSCPLVYFQTSASLREGWILDNHQRVALEDVRKLERVAIAVHEMGREVDCNLQEVVKKGLLEYFMKDMARDGQRYYGFDCYAFVSLLTDAKLDPKNPPFTYERRSENPGDVVVFSANAQLPDSIKHWALCVGEDLFISKFGRSGEGRQTLVEVARKEAMLHLYSCSDVFVALRKDNAASWDWSAFPNAGH